MGKVKKIKVSKKAVSLLLAGGLALVLNNYPEKEKAVHKNDMMASLDDKMHDYEDILQVYAKKIDGLEYIGRFEYPIPPRDTRTSLYRFVSPTPERDGYYFDLYEFTEKKNKLR